MAMLMYDKISGLYIHNTLENTLKINYSKIDMISRQVLYVEAANVLKMLREREKEKAYD